jgi:hypothetical protein
VYEHDRNDAMVEVDEDTAKRDAQRKMPAGELLPMKATWTWEEPKHTLNRIGAE